MTLGLNLLVERPPNARRNPLADLCLYKSSTSAGLFNAMRYNVAMEVRAMLSVSSSHQPAPSIRACIDLAVIVQRLDVSNDRASRPIPVARST